MRNIKIGIIFIIIIGILIIIQEFADVIYLALTNCVLMFDNRYRV